MNQWFFLFKIACFKNSWKKSFFCWFMCKQHCKLYSKVGSFNHKNMLLNHKHLPPQPSNPFLPPYKLHIYILVEDLDTHWLIWNQEKRERTWNIKFLWSFWLIFYDWFFKQIFFRCMSTVSRAINVIDIFFELFYATFTPFN